MKRYRVIIRGRVHGVFFRSFTKDQARLLPVTGWVRNNLDGTVEAVFEGEAKSVMQMLAWCHQGSPYSHVDSVEKIEEIYTGEFDTFFIN